MSTKLITFAGDESMAQARELMDEKNIRHLPIVENGKPIGLLTQKVILAKIFNIVSVFGAQSLARREKRVEAKEIMATEFETVPATTSIKDAADYFIDNKHGTLLVTDEDGNLIGIVTSQDFVKLIATMFKD